MNEQLLNESGRAWRVGLLVAMHVILALVAASVIWFVWQDSPTGAAMLFHVMPAQLVLLSFWLAMGRSSYFWRVGIVVMACAVIAWLHVMPWPFDGFSERWFRLITSATDRLIPLFTIQIGIICSYACFFWILRRAIAQMAPNSATQETNKVQVRFSTLDLLIFTTALAIEMAILRWLFDLQALPDIDRVGMYITKRIAIIIGIVGMSVTIFAGVAARDWPVFLVGAVVASVVDSLPSKVPNASYHENMNVFFLIPTGLTLLSALVLAASLVHLRSCGYGRAGRATGDDGSE